MGSQGRIPNCPGTTGKRSPRSTRNAPRECSSAGKENGAADYRKVRATNSARIITSPREARERKDTAVSPYRDLQSKLSSKTIPLKTQVTKTRKGPKKK